MPPHSCGGCRSCGVDVRERSATLAADVAQVIDAPTYVFNDWHAVMAFGLAGQVDLEEQLLSENRRHAVGTNRAVAARAGLALLEGFSSFAAGRFNRAIDLLTDVRSCAHAVGGSNAQRDVVDLTLIAAAARAGEHGMARQLVAERVGRRPGTAGGGQSAPRRERLVVLGTASPPATWLCPLFLTNMMS